MCALDLFLKGCETKEGGKKKDKCNRNIWTHLIQATTLISATCTEQPRGSNVAVSSLSSSSSPSSYRQFIGQACGVPPQGCPENWTQNNQIFISNVTFVFFFSLFFIEIFWAKKKKTTNNSQADFFFLPKPGHIKKCSCCGSSLFQLSLVTIEFLKEHAEFSSSNEKKNRLRKMYAAVYNIFPIITAWNHKRIRWMKMSTWHILLFPTETMI